MHDTNKVPDLTGTFSRPSRSVAGRDTRLSCGRAQLLPKLSGSTQHSKASQRSSGRRAEAPVVSAALVWHRHAASGVLGLYRHCLLRHHAEPALAKALELVVSASQTASAATGPACCSSGTLLQTSA